MEYGIIFQGDASPLASELAEALGELGLYRGKTDKLTPELLDALNTYRTANRLLCLDFCDPVTLRTLGIECGGDEILALARFGESASETELECYDVCAGIVAESRALGLTITEVIARRGTHTENTEISETALTAAVLAFAAQ